MSAAAFASLAAFSIAACVLVAAITAASSAFLSDSTLSVTALSITTNALELSEAFLSTSFLSLGTSLTISLPSLFNIYIDSCSLLGTRMLSGVCLFVLLVLVILLPRADERFSSMFDIVSFASSSSSSASLDAPKAVFAPSAKDFCAIANISKRIKNNTKNFFIVASDKKYTVSKLR